MHISFFFLILWFFLSSYILTEQNPSCSDKQGKWLEIVQCLSVISDFDIELLVLSDLGRNACISIA